MTDTSILFNSSHLNINVIDVLTTELQKLHLQYPHRFSKSIHVLPTICNNVDSQWKQRLLQLKQNQNENSIVFIPYNVGNFFWTGVLIKFQANGQAEQATLIDPVISLTSLLNELQKQFSTIYPDILVRSKNARMYQDREHYESHIAANLVRLIEEAQSPDIQSMCFSQSNNSPTFYSIERSINDSTSLKFSNTFELLDNERKSLSIVPQIDDVLNQDTISNWKDDRCSITHEMLKNLSDDFNSMPLCAERYIFSLIFHISLHLTDTAIVTSWIDIQNEFECLKERLKTEEFETIDMQNLIEAVFLNLKHQNWKNALVILQKMLEYISPLKINELVRFVEKSTDAIDLMKGENVIVILGGSKEDQSNLIHFLSGSKIKDTSYMTLVRVNLKDIGGYSNETVILCDSSAFEDTNTSELDIANTIDILKALQKCKSVKFVVLVSYESIQDQLCNLKGLIKTLVGLIPEIENYIETFSYIYTKFPSNESSKAYELLANLNETMSEMNRTDSHFMKFFSDMLRKSRKKTIVLNSTDDPLGILEELIQSSGINYPDEVFHVSIKEKWKVTLKKQMRIYYTSIPSAIKRAEYDFVKYKLNQLKRLNELVNQACIGEVYNDCITYISQYLLNNYQKGISYLNHCLFDQTVLNDEDIHRYRVYIDHDKLAEELRNDHLGREEVVYNRAFIKYLNEQVEILLEGIRDRDVNDIFVKQTLDKIKLLSNSFNDIGINRYRDICKVFSVKFKSIHESFERSVSVNEFEKSTKDITIVFQALTVLHGHLDEKDMEVQYIQMKEYFIKYLNDSIEKVNYMFVNEILDEYDITSLKSCVYILENAANMSALHSHISKELIDRIYENFLSKIVVRFEVVAKKIHSGINNQISFNNLEQLMKELDSLRTISTIEQKTNQTYCNILEKLAEYLYELIKQVEESLAGLIQRKENVSYQNLRKSSMNLNEVQWIKKYRALAYSYTMHTVEELVLQHIKEMKKSMMESDLDLDSYDKIELIQQILSDMNEMKCFETILPRVSQHLAEVHIYVNELIEEICTIVQDTFSIEKWKQHGYPPVNLSKAENALYYLSTCRKIPIEWNIDYMLVYNNLKEFIRQYSDYIQDEMKDCFKAIKQYPKITKEDLFGKVRILSNRLVEISEIKNKYPQAFSCFTNQQCLQQWQEELSDDLIDLEIEMETLHITQQSILLNEKLTILKALSKLDSFLEGKKYIDIYHKYQNIVFLQMKNIFEEVLNAIRQDDYETVAYDIIKLPLSDNVGQYFSTQFKRALRVKLNNLMDETKMQAIMLDDSLELEQIKSLVNNLKRLHKAKRFVSEYFDMHDELNTCVEEVKKLIEIRINRYFERIKAVIIINDFSEFEKRIDLITLVCTILGNYCSKMILDEIETLTKHQTNIVLKDIVDKYSEMDIDEYFFHPPIYIFNKFEDAININPKYIETFNKIKQIIFCKFRKELEQSKLEETREKKIMHLRRFESAVKYLPETIRNALEIELKHCKDDLVLAKFI